MSLGSHCAADPRPMVSLMTSYTGHLEKRKEKEAAEARSVCERTELSALSLPGFEDKSEMSVLPSVALGSNCSLKPA